MSKIFEFLWYCIKTMFDGFGAMFGHIPEDYGLKEVFVGLGTLANLFILISFILLLTGHVKFKK